MQNNNAVIEALYLYSFVLQFYSKNIMPSTKVQAVNCLFLTKILYQKLRLLPSFLSIVIIFIANLKLRRYLF